jgi:hypothetical protein
MAGVYIGEYGWSLFDCMAFCPRCQSRGPGPLPGARRVRSKKAAAITCFAAALLIFGDSSARPPDTAPGDFQRVDTSPSDNLPVLTSYTLTKQREMCRFFLLTVYLLSKYTKLKKKKNESY